MKTKRKLKLKKHWEFILLMWQLLLFISLCGEWEGSVLMFIISRTVILLIMLFNQFIFTRYTDLCGFDNLFEGEDLDD